MATWIRDVRQAFRSLSKQPTFSLTAILTLALGIGATASIFSVVDAVLLRPLPYKDAGRLVHIAHDLRARNVEDFPVAPADFYDMKNLSSSFEDVASVFTFQQTFPGDGAGRQAEQLPVAVVSTSMLRLLGLPILHGRDFVDADGAPIPAAPAPVAGAPPVQGPPPPPVATILSYDYWQRRFDADVSVIGTIQEVGAQRLEVVGVLAPGAELLFPPGIAIERFPEIWTADRTDLVNGSRINVFLRVIARLHADVTLASAQGEIDALAADLRKQFPIKETADMHFRLAPMQEDLVAEVRPILMALMGAVAFVLLIACANVANLLLVRTAGRERELAIRTALGGSRARLIRQLLVESLVLSLTASALGLVMARLAIQGFRVMAPANVPRLDTVTVDPAVVAFGIAVSVASVALFGLLPSLRASRPDVMQILRRTGRSESLGQGRWIRNGVVITEVALSFVLLVGAGLMVRSFVAIYQASPGFSAENLLTFQLTNQQQIVNSPVAALGLTRDVQEHLEALPGVTAVTATSFMPLVPAQEPLTRYGLEEALADPTKYQQANFSLVQPGYFAAMETPILDGREFGASDNMQGVTSVVVDSVLAARMFPDQRAVGQRIWMRTVRNEPDPFEIIGVVQHQRAISPAFDGREAIYLPDAFFGGGAVGQWAVRAGGDAAALASGVRRAVADVDPRLGVFQVQTMDALVDEAATGTRFVLWLLSLFAGVAMVLAAVGLYGVLSTAVRQRTAEIGVRMAFGATTGNIFGLIVTSGVTLSAVGIAIGTLVALGVTNAISGLLVDVSPTDPLTYGVIAGGFLLVAIIACVIPAHRASRLNPLEALRQD